VWLCQEECHSQAGLSDAGTASSHAGVHQLKLSGWPPALEELNNSWGKLQGAHGLVSGCNPRPPLTLIGKKGTTCGRGSEEEKKSDVYVELL